MGEGSDPGKPESNGIWRYCMNKKHVFFYKLVRPVIIVLLWLKFGYTFTVAKNLPENYIVLSNHTTDYDPLFLGASFPRQMYFVGSEHIARWKHWYELLKSCFAPIMRPKGTLGASTTMEVLRKVKGGASVCIFAEGARCWDGITNPILPSTGRTIKSARCGLVTYKIVGGYFASPNWSGKNTRRGYVHGAPVHVYTKEQLAQMSVDEINAAIVRDLHEDAYARQLAEPKRYRGKGLAEQMENLLFICPQCGTLDTIHSHGDTVTCSACGHAFRYDEYGMLQGTSFTTVKELAAWQRKKVEDAADRGVSYALEDAVLSTVANHKESVVDSGAAQITAEAITCGGTEIPLDKILDLQIHGRHALVFSTMEAYYELVAPEHNVLKFMLLYGAYKRRVKIEK